MPSRLPLTGIIGLLGVSLLFGSLIPNGATANPMHLALAESWPKADEKITDSPKHIRLRFTQTPQMKGTSIRLLPIDVDPIDIGKTTAMADDDKIVSASIPIRLGYGTYQVIWRAMSRDGHVVRGDFKFELQAERSN